MALWLEQRASDFETRFGALLAAKRESADVNDAVAAIIDRVRRDKDAGLIDLTLRYDRVDLRKIGMRVTSVEIAEARSASTPTSSAALELARDRILDHHRRQVPGERLLCRRSGRGARPPLDAGSVRRALCAGGTASYPSSVLMNAVPAKVAEVERVVMVVPAPDGVLNPLVLVAAALWQCL